ncbi:MAG: hypothetical protein KKB45_09135 [Gammaproteobacteria bacterium]|jgi:hypothetical protein|nr:hypothetical protein [Gammaproteobacteria bacterium]
MTGINLNVQNNYAALYNTPTPSTTVAEQKANPLQQAQNTVNAGEKLTLSAQGIALLKQEQNDALPPVASIASNGFGLRPPSP